MEKSEDTWKFIEKNSKTIFFIIISIMAFYLRTLLIHNVTSDFKYCINEWFNDLKLNGGLLGLKLDIGNYNVPYLFILALLTYLPINNLVSVKMVSIIFDFICAITIKKIAEILLEDNKNKEFISLLIYAVVLFLPTVILNSAYWGQADSIYTAFILISLKYVLEKKYFKAFIFLGIAFSFKLQFIFILPLYIILYISERKFSISYFGIILWIYAIMLLPAVIFGRSLISCVNIYVSQLTEYDEYISMNFPGVWNLFLPIGTEGNLVFSPNNDVSKIGILITIFIYSIFAYTIFYKKIKLDKQKIIEIALWSVMIATFFLPHMHDRYLFLGDLLSILYFIYNRDKLYVPVGITLISTYSYCVYLFEQCAIPIQYVSFLNLILIVLITKDMCKKYFKE